MGAKTSGAVEPHPRISRYLSRNSKLEEGLTTNASLSVVMEAIGTVASVFAIYNQLEQCGKCYANHRSRHFLRVEIWCLGECRGPGECVTPVSVVAQSD